jgi:CRP-like cAMP-binding protein
MKAEDSKIPRRSSVFRSLPNENFETVARPLQEEHHDFGDVVAKQGDQADSFYVLTRGRACGLKIKAFQAIQQHASVHQRDSVAGPNARGRRSRRVTPAELPAMQLPQLPWHRREDWQAGTGLSIKYWNPAP